MHVPPIGGSLSPLQTVPTPWTLALTRPLHHCGRLRCCVINWEALCIDSQTFHGPDRLRGYCLTNGAVWHRDDNGSSLFRQHKNRAPEMFRRICQNVITRSYQADQRETIFDFRTFRLLWLGWGFFPLASSFLGARMFQVSAGAHYSLDKEVWTYWTQTQNNRALRPPPPALSVIGNCLSHPFYLWVSVCLTLVQLGLVSPWSHQSAWRPVKAISPSRCVSPCQLGACVSSSGTDSPPGGIHSLL